MIDYFLPIWTFNRYGRITICTLLVIVNMKWTRRDFHYAPRVREHIFEPEASACFGAEQLRSFSLLQGRRSTAELRAH
jgi:hypothetical protein